nr:MAG TPA: hypothetical protein [Crassvirales sp.]
MRPSIFVGKVIALYVFESIQLPLRNLSKDCLSKISER